MKWSTRIGTFAGIGVYVHTTFFILIAWVAFAHWQVEQSAGAAVRGVVFILAGVVGVLTRGDLLTALARQEQRSPVAQVMRRDFMVADPSDMLDLRSSACRAPSATRSRSSAGESWWACSRWITWGVPERTGRDRRPSPGRQLAHA